MFDLNEKVTVWNRTGGSTYGGFNWSMPVVIDARYAYRIKKIVDKTGADTSSDITVYFDSELVDLDSKIYIGESTDLTPPAGAKEVINFAMTPSGTALRVAFL